MITLEAAVRHHLAKLGVTLWPGVAFDLTDEDEREKAVQWLVEEMCHVYAAADEL